MLFRLAAGLIGISALICAGGCADQTTTVTSVNFIQGVPNGSPATQSAGASVKTWPSSAWVNPSGTSWTQNGDNGGLEVWCNSNGDWSISQFIQNHGLFWHTYDTTVAFGHITGGDPNSFTAYATHISSSIIVHHGNSNNTEASGTGDDAIKANFDNINAARASLHEH